MVNKEEQHKDLQLVPETVLKRRHHLDEMKVKRAARVRVNNKVFSKSGKFYVKKPESFLAQAKSRTNHNIRFKRVMKKGMQKRASNKKEMAVKKVDDETSTTTATSGAVVVKEIKYQSNSVGAKMVFCVRIRDSVGLSVKVKHVLWKLRLHHVNEGVFLKYDEKIRKMLHLVEPWVLYGPPSKEIVSDLINRRGFGHVEKHRVPLSDNTIIEKELGKNTGIICVEDLVHELHSVGDNFAVATQFLWPFRLAPQKTRFETQKLGEKEGRIYGDRGEEIDCFIKQML